MCRPYAEKYAADQDLFFKDYVAAHLKLSELGVKWEEVRASLQAVPVLLAPALASFFTRQWLWPVLPGAVHASNSSESSPAAALLQFQLTQAWYCAGAIHV